jgi:serine/threonine protein kinase
MSLVLGKYEKIKKLGKGSYGDVWLIRDQSKHEYALKQVAKKLIKSDPYLEEYISGEK